MKEKVKTKRNLIKIRIWYLSIISNFFSISNKMKMPNFDTKLNIRLVWDSFWKHKLNY